MTPAHAHWWPKDTENPYRETKPFDWIRAYHVGGRSILLGNNPYRLSDLDFEANAKEGIAVDWPVRYKDIAPGILCRTFYWGKVDKRRPFSIAGWPVFTPMELNCVEEKLKASMKRNSTGL